MSDEEKKAVALPDSILKLFLWIVGPSLLVVMLDFLTPLFSSGIVDTRIVSLGYIGILVGLVIYAVTYFRLNKAHVRQKIREALERKVNGKPK